MLACVILLSKLFGFFYRILFMRIAGPDVVGIYMTTYPAFIFFISLAQIGLPLAVTKLVAAYFAAGQLHKVQLVLKKSIRINMLLLLLFIPLFVWLSPIIANQLLHNEAAIYPLLVSLAAIPFVLLSGLIKAYLQGIEKISVTAWTLFFEQIIRIACISLLFPLIINESPAIAAAQAMAITVVTELLAALFIWPFYLREKKKLLKNHSIASTPEAKQTKLTDAKVEADAQFTSSIVSTSQLFHIAIPTAGGKLFGTFTWFLEPIIFLKALGNAGLTAAVATSLYGIISGVHIPLLLFPAFIPAALSIVLVPAISSALARKHYDTINLWITIAVRVSALIGCYAATVFFLYGDSLAEQLFHIENTYNFMQILAPIFFFYYLQSPLMSILQAMDGAKVAMWNSIYGGIAKLLCMFGLASIPVFSMYGAIIAIGFGVLITTFLHMLSLKSINKIKMPIYALFMPYLCFLIMIFIPKLETPSIYLQIAYSVIILTVFLLLTRQLRWRDFQLLLRTISKKTN